MIHLVVVYCHVTVNLQEGVTALYLASECGHMTTVELLVEAGASLDVQRNVSCYPDTPHLLVSLSLSLLVTVHPPSLVCTLLNSQ